MNRTVEQQADEAQIATEETQAEDDRPQRKRPRLQSKEEMEAQLEEEAQAGDVRVDKLSKESEEEMLAKEQKAALQLTRPEAFNLDFQTSTGMIYMEDEEIKAKLADLKCAVQRVHDAATLKRRLSEEFGEPSAL